MSKNKTVKKIQSKGVRTLAWLTLGVASIGGTAAAGTFIGDWINNVFGWLPWEWMAPLILAILFITTVIDLLIDLLPNKAAVYSVIAMPSVAKAAPGKFGDTVGGWFDALMDWVNSTLIQWLGTDSAVGLAVACIVAAVLMARRVIKKSAGATAEA
ncbi:hypothetical protein O7598_31110 [Micromonospora sp. WMMC241]|uniref:hypothetical protein n=1 Tax=Micromonospora sp. WMMC241 TaxID=3015159 RepID=UPI0022B68D60|nr:hypothetical protein [Micromonospora sp. WMMC241]MCZ7440798.1 hypothetical protein [Micromonospora sp. WMMC241]MCZ7440875.1 hypothetical protein [Micromonospora sp. WMMC241]